MQPDANANMRHDVEKPPVMTEELEHESIEKQPQDTFDDLDLSNTLASRGDDAEGPREWSFKGFMAAFSLAGFYVGGAVPTLLVGASLSYIAVDLHAEFATWLITANTLALSVVTPFIGYLTDLVGPRYIILSGAMATMIGMVLLGTAHSFGQAVAGMAMSGIGCGICEVNSLAGIAELAPVRLRGLYIGIITLLIIPFNPYPFYTQFLCRDATWRWVPWIVLIWVGTWWIVCALTFFPDSRKHRIQGLTKTQILRRMDWIGGASSIIGLTLILVALQDGGYRHPWTSAAILAPLLIGVAVFAFFVAWEGWYAPHPMIPRVLFKERGVWIPLTTAFIAGVSYYALLGFKPLLFQKLYYTKTPVQIGALTEGFSLGLLFGSCGPNILISYTKGHVRFVIMAFALIMTGFTGALIHSNPSNPIYTAVMAAFVGLGIGGVLVPSATVAMTCCPDSLIATVSGLGMSVRGLGGAVGTTVYSAVYQNKLRHYLPTTVAQYAIEAGLAPQDAPKFVKAFLTPGTNMTTIPNATPAIISSAREGQALAYAETFKYVWATSVAFGAVACVVAWFIPNTRKYMTNRVAVDYANVGAAKDERQADTKSA